MEACFAYYTELFLANEKEAELICIETCSPEPEEHNILKRSPISAPAIAVQ